MSTAARTRLALPATLLTLASGAAAFLAAQGPTTPLAAGDVLPVKETRLALFSAEADTKHWLVSPDWTRSSYPVKQGKRQAMALDGATGPWWDDVVENSGAFSADSRHFSYVARRGDKWFAVIDGNASQPWDDIVGKRVAWSANGARVGYCARSGKTWRTIIDGVESPPSSERLRSLLFSADGKRVAFVAGSLPTFGWDPKVRVVLDGAEGTRYGDISGLWFSPDGSRFVACAKVKGLRTKVVIDGAEGPEFETTSLEYPRSASPFEAGGGTVVYEGDRDGKSVLVVDGKVEREVNGGFGPVAASRDGKRLAYWYGLRNKWWQLTKDPRGEVRLVTDGVESPIYRGVKDGPVFSPDGSRLAYAAALENGDAAVVVDGQQQATHQGVGAGSMRFSPDGRHLAYFAQDHDAWFLVIDGKPRRTTYSGVRRQPIAFTPDSQHVVFVAKDGEGARLVVDDVMKSDRYDWIGADVGMTGPHSFQFAATRGRELLRVEVDVARRE